MKRALTKRSTWTILQNITSKSFTCRALSAGNNPHLEIKASCFKNSGPSLSSARSLSSAPVSSLAEWRSTFPDVQIPNVSFSEFIFNCCDEYRDRVAASDYPTGRQYTFRQLKDLSIRVASALHKHGYRKGDVILTCTVNLPEFTILILAAGCLGVTVSPANPAYTPPELSRVLLQSGARAIFTIPQLIPLVQEASADPDLPHNIKEIYTFGHAVEGFQFFNTLMEDDGKAFPDTVDLDPAKDVLFLPFSSGTTGLPKGVMLSHRNIIANILQIRESITLTAENRTLGILPFFHIYGLVTVQLAPLYVGMHVITVPRFDPEMFLRALQDKQITLLQIAPPLVLFLAAHPLVSQFDLSSVKDILVGGAPLGKALTLQCQSRLGCPIYQGYGLTETSPVLNLDTAPGHPGTIGPLVASTQAKIVDLETGRTVKVGETGEYCINGPQKMLGYLNNQKATDEMIDKEGWLQTGDLGYVREDGIVVIEDRLKELIKYKGFQVPPAELEALLLTHPAVLDAGVVGVPDDEAGELPRAYVTLKPSMTASAQDIAKFVEEKVSPAKRLRGGVEFIDEIPKSQSGKILRRILKTKALQSS